jgi:outer membrane biosynthesis protein TonB
MIKNLLYSLFLHSILLAVIYANFALKKIPDNKTSEFSVSLISIAGEQQTNQITEAVKEVPKKDLSKKNKDEIRKKAKSPNDFKKDAVKEQNKEIAKSKPEQSIAKPSESDVAEFKSQAAPEKKQEESKNKNDELANKNKDEVKKEVQQDTIDLGAKEEAKEEQEEIKSEATQEASSTQQNSNNIEGIDLSAREKFNIQAQLNRCYVRAITESKSSSKIRVSLKVRISEDGYIDLAIEDMIDMQRYNSFKPYKIAIDNIRRAIDLCSPLRNLPLDKYEAWKEAVLDFDENEATAAEEVK